MTDDIEETTLAEVFTKLPPNQTRIVSDFWSKALGNKHEYAIPELKLECDEDQCADKGVLTFRHCERKVICEGQVVTYLYKCCNCDKYEKLFFILQRPKNSVSKTIVSKIGEFPPYGPMLPRSLQKLIGDEKDNLFKGYRCEKQGLGIGAYSYYRRVVESQKVVLFDKIIAITKELEPESPVIAELEEAQLETQFSKSVKRIKNAFPQMLLVNGHNPMKLVHNALSEGLHALTDEDCLDRANSIRLVLTDFSKILEIATTQDKELKAAVQSFLVPSY